MVTGSLRVVFLGTPQFAVATLDAILASRHRPVLVVTQPDRARGRGQRVSEAPVKAAATRAGIPLLQPSSARDPAVVEAIDQTGADIGVVAAYGKILPTTLLSRPRLGMINVHASLLPKYRGAAPVHRAVLAGEPETGVSIMRVVEALDAGPMFACVRSPIGDDETSEHVEGSLARLGASLLIETLDALVEGRARETPQDHAAATYAPRLTKAEGLVNWSLGASQIHNLVRGLYPWPHAYTFHEGARLILLRSSPSIEAASAPPGTILEAHGDVLRVATGQGTLRLLQLQVEGKRPMATREFLAGHRVSSGVRLSAGP
jgi:methionyl-tRNA formyltransferase